MKDSPSIHRTWRWTGWRPGVGLRMALGCVFVLLCAGAASAVVVSHEVTTLRNNLSVNPSLRLAPGTLAPAGWGEPQTLLLVGNDQRNHTTTAPVLPHSNEMLLVRIDPGEPWISMMSIPRELYVPIQTPSDGTVTTRINASLMFGGIPLLISTIKQVTGLPVNHVIEIDFNNFKTAIDELGCVYSTVDRRYLHVNTAYSEQYQAINIQPGYQKLCGTQALQFVSYRHGDTSLVRDARDQDFLLDAKQQFGPTLVDNLHEFERIFGQTVQTDAGLHTTSGILDLLGTMVSAAGKPVRQVQFQVNLLPTYDTATPEQIAASVHSFLYGADVVPKSRVAASALVVHKHRNAAALQLMDTPSSELAAIKPEAARLPFTLEYPGVRSADAVGGPLQVDGCSGIEEPLVCLRLYHIHDEDGKVAYPAYVIVTSQGNLGQYYDIQGTTWTRAPMFNHPSQLIHVGGRTYALYYSGERLNVIAWWEHGAVYWVHNTLTDALYNSEMLAIAESTTPLTDSTRLAAHGGRVDPVTIPLPVTASPKTTTLQTIGAAGGLLVLLALPLMGLQALRRRRELAQVRIALDEASRSAARVLAAAHDVTAGAVARSGSSRSSPRPASYSKSSA